MFLIATCPSVSQQDHSKTNKTIYMEFCEGIGHDHRLHIKMDASLHFHYPGMKLKYP